MRAMREVVRQLSAALRSLSRQPAVMLPAVLTLALGIGAITALFAYLAYMLWPTMAAPEPGRVVDSVSATFVQSSPLPCETIARRTMVSLGSAF